MSENSQSPFMSPLDVLSMRSPLTHPFINENDPLTILSYDALGTSKLSLKENEQDRETGSKFKSAHKKDVLELDQAKNSLKK